MRKREHEYSLLNYATYKWAVHANNIQHQLEERDLKLMDAMMHSGKFKGNKSNFHLWINCLAQKNQEKVLTAEPFYYAASFGLEVYVERLARLNMINKDPYSRFFVDHESGRVSSTTLQIACVRGTPSTVELLLKEGADPNSTNRDGRSCLW